MTPPGLQFPVSPVDVRVPWLASRLLCVGNKEGENKVMSSEKVDEKEEDTVGVQTKHVLWAAPQQQKFCVIIPIARSTEMPWDSNTLFSWAVSSLS